MNRKQKEFQESVLPKLKEEFKYTNDLQVPRIKKIVVSRGINSEDAKNGNLVDSLVKDIALIAGQAPVTTKAKKSIATFKLREGTINGAMVTLRGERMYAFFDRLVSVASPRIRDFRGIHAKGDGRGNFTLGIRDQRIFPEVVEDSVARGFQVTIVTSAETDQEAKSLLKKMGLALI